MEYRNLTAFPSLNFVGVTPDRKEFHSLVLKVTHQIQPDGTLQFAAEQSPLVMADEFYGEMAKTSIKLESDLAPFKPVCDVIINGSAAAPEGKPAKRFDAGIKITRGGATLLDKKVTVTGPRYWEKRFLPFTGWKLTEPEPIQSLPIRYEYAHGGECRVNPDEPGAKRVARKFRLTPEQRAMHPDGQKAPVAQSCCPTNGVGLGYAEPWYLKAKKLTSVPAPQIESPANPVKQFGQFYAPEGFGILGKVWSPRRELTGTMDEAFIKSRQPLPNDFNFAFWNGAQPDMQIPWLSGGENIELLNIPIANAPGVTRFSLPEAVACATVTYESEEMAAIDFNLDTLIIEADKATVTAVYRLKLAMEPEIETVEAELVSLAGKAALNAFCQEVTAKTLEAKEQEAKELEYA